MSEAFIIPIRMKAYVGDDETPLSLVGFEPVYEVDEIPKARLYFAVGARLSPDDEEESGDAIAVLQSLRHFAPVYVTLRIDPPGDVAPPDKDPGFPQNEEFVCFRGYAGMLAQERAFVGGHAALVLECFGPEGALSGASRMAAGITVDATPNSAQAGIYVVGLTTDPQVNIFAAVLAVAQGNPQDNLWTNGFEPLLRVLADKADEISDSNIANDALDRFENTPDGFGAVQSALLHPPKLQIVCNAEEKKLKAAIMQQIADAGYGAWASDNDMDGGIWSMIQSFCQVFHLHFVPAVETCALVPLCWLLSDEGEDGIPTENDTPAVWRVIDPSEYFRITETRDRDYRDFTSVGEVALHAEGFAFDSFEREGVDIPLARTKVFGFAQFDERETGRVLLAPAPQWIMPQGADAKDSLVEAPDAYTKKTDVPEAQGTEELKKLVDSGIGDRIASSILRREAFASRGMSLTGRLRFDICPGSFVRVNTIGLIMTGEEASLYGVVKSVQHSVIAGSDGGSSGHAVTSFKIVNVRNQVDQDKNALSEDPVYGQRWSGGKLVIY